MLWDDFVVGLDAERQEKALFQGSMGNMLDGAYWQIIFNTNAKKIPFFGDNPQVAIQAVFTLVALGMIAFYFLHHRRKQQQERKSSAAGHWLQRWSPRLARLLGQATQAEESVQVEFYQRVEALLHRFGFDRRQPQTAREFFATVTAELAPPANVRDIAASLETVAHSFYTVRFSGHSLSEKEHADVELAIQRLEQALFSDNTTKER
jgi:hypothetical protein